MHLPALAAATLSFVLSVSGPPVQTPPDEPAPRPAGIQAVATEPPAAVLTVGTPAPEVSWDGPDGRPQRLRDLRAQGHVLLLFFPDDAGLAALERDRDRLLDLRVVPAAVLDRSPAALTALARRLGLHYTLVPDPRRVIAAQFNAVDPASGRGVPSWFVLDRRGTVRDLDHGAVPAGGYVRLASGALLLPAADAPLPARAR